MLRIAASSLNSRERLEVDGNEAAPSQPDALLGTSEVFAKLPLYKHAEFVRSALVGL